MAAKRILLVSTEACDDVEECLERTDCEVIKVRDGIAAVDRAKHAMLDAVILVSAGRAMDRAETALNLRDINPTMEIILIAGHNRGRGGPPPTSELLGGTIPHTRVLTLHELDKFFASPEWGRHDSER